jgi:ornithine cyclodeaminase/alanine dehydrogenase-like protein (mu-crystallin family)
MTLLLKNQEIIPLLTMKESLEILDGAYKRYIEGKILNVPYTRFVVPTRTEGRRWHMYELRAAVPELGVSGIRLSSGINDFTSGTQRRVEMPEAMRLDQIQLFDIQTAEPLAILAGEHIQLLRVGANSALGVKYLAREGSETLGIIGSGRQAETQLEAIALVRPLKRVLVYSRSAENREQFAEQARSRYAFSVEAVDSTDALIERSDIITAATSATSPTFDGSLICRGTHVNTLNAWQIDETTVRRSSLFTTTKSRVYEYLFHGEKRDYKASSPYWKEWDRVQELERIMVGETTGRRSDDEITLFYGDGAGLQFVTLGHHVFTKARAQGIGRELPTDWFLGT